MKNFIVLFLSGVILGQGTDCPPLVAEGVQFAGKLIPAFRGPTNQIVDYDKCIYPGKLTDDDSCCITHAA